MDKEFRVGRWLVQPPLCRISNGDEPIRVRPKVMDILVVLAHHAGEVVSKDCLLNEVWGTDAVSESALTRSITELRQAFGDPVDDPSILETIPKRGYRLVAQVSTVDRDVARVPLSRRRGPRAVAIAALVVVLIVIGLTAVVVNRRSETPHAAEWVLVAAFDNRTGDPLLDGTVEYAFELELAGSPFLKIVPRDNIDEMLRFMRKPVETRIDLAIGREIAARDGTIGALITGRIQKIGSRYTVTTGVVNPSTGELMAGFTDDAVSPNELLARVRRQAVAMRSVLGDKRVSLAASRHQLEKVTTSSIAALKAYSIASATLDRRTMGAPSDVEALASSAERDLRRALELDPAFASAQILLAWAIHARQVSRGRRNDAGEYLAAADAASALPASDAERFFILASIHDLRAESMAGWPDAPVASEPPRVKGELSEAIDAYERYLDLRPADSRALRNVTIACERLGRHADLARILGHVSLARPNSFDANVSAAAAYIRSGDLIAAETALNRADGRLNALIGEPDAPDAGRLQVALLRAKLAWLRRDAVAAALELDRIAPTDSERFAAMPSLDWGVAAAQLVFADVALGRIHHAQQVAMAIAYPPVRTNVLATVFVAAQQPAELKRLLRVNSSSRNILGRGGTYLVNGGLLAEAKRLADELERSPTIVPAYALFVRERIAAAEGRDADCLAFGERSLHLQLTRYNNQSLTIARDMADAYLKLGRPDEGARVLNDETAYAAESVGRDWASGFPWVVARNELAEIYRRRGRTEEAAAIDDELLRLLAAADEDYPILNAVKKRVASGRERLP